MKTFLVILAAVTVVAVLARPSAVKDAVAWLTSKLKKS